MLGPCWLAVRGGGGSWISHKLTMLAGVSGSSVATMSWSADMARRPAARSAPRDVFLAPLAARWEPHGLPRRAVRSLVLSASLSIQAKL